MLYLEGLGSNGGTGEDGDCNTNGIVGTESCGGAVVSDIEVCPTGLLTIGLCAEGYVYSAPSRIALAGLEYTLSGTRCILW